VFYQFFDKCILTLTANSSNYAIDTTFQQDLLANLAVIYFSIGQRLSFSRMKIHSLIVIYNSNNII